MHSEREDLSHDETGTPESGELVLPQRLVYPDYYVKSLVVAKGTPKESYMSVCLGRRQGPTDNYTGNVVTYMYL